MGHVGYTLSARTIKFSLNLNRPERRGSDPHRAVPIQDTRDMIIRSERIMARIAVRLSLSEDSSDDQPFMPRAGSITLMTFVLIQGHVGLGLAYLWLCRLGFGFWPNHRSGDLVIFQYPEWIESGQIDRVIQYLFSFCNGLGKGCAGN